MFVNIDIIQLHSVQSIPLQKTSNFFKKRRDLLLSNKRVFIIAGEASSDLHAADLIDEVRKKDSSVYFLGIGGKEMRVRGAEILLDASQVAISGIFELFPYLYKIYRVLRMVRRQLIEQPPDLIILIDFPTFNLKVAKIAKALKIKILYYISPKIWAWRPKRIKLIKQRVDQMAVIFPFEVAYYERAHVPVKLVRNYLLDQLTCSFTPEQARAHLKLDTKKITIGLLPGSRLTEIKYLLPLLLETAKRLYQERDNVQFILPLASTLKQQDIARYLSKINYPIHIVIQQTKEVLRSADMVIAASGTVTLEAALMNVPMLIVYRMSALSFAIISRLVKIPYAGLCNIILGKEIVKEFIQDKATPELLLQEIKKILNDPVYVESMRNNLSLVRKALDVVKRTDHISAIVLDMLSNS